MELELSREFKGIWIPKEIWLSVDISLTEKVFLAEIDSFEKKDGCFASNRYFANFFKMTKGRVSQIITKLQDKGFVFLEYKMTPGTEEISQRIVKINWRKIRSQGI